jgi:ribosome-associated protein
MSDPGAAIPEGLRLSHGLVVPFDELTWRFSTAGGPGGQHVNTANTKAEVTLDVAASPSLPQWAKSRIVPQLGPIVSSAAGDRRSQLRNRELALERLATRLSTALEVRATRRPTRPTKASQRRRLDSKRHRSDIKRQRRQDRSGGESD